MVVAVTLIKEPSWLDHYVAYLSDGSLSMDEKEAEKVGFFFWLFEDKKLY